MVLLVRMRGSGCGGEVDSALRQFPGPARFCRYCQPLSSEQEVPAAAWQVVAVVAREEFPVGVAAAAGMVATAPRMNAVDRTAIQLVTFFIEILPVISWCTALAFAGPDDPGSGGAPSAPAACPQFCSIGDVRVCSQ